MKICRSSQTAGRNFNLGVLNIKRRVTAATTMTDGRTVTVIPHFTQQHIGMQCLLLCAIRRSSSPSQTPYPGAQRGFTLLFTSIRSAVCLTTGP
jgi:hypothetical protein